MSNSKPEMKEIHIVVIQVLFVVGIAYGSQSIDFDQKHMWLANIARYVVYLLTILGTREASKLLYGVAHGTRPLNLDVLEGVNSSLAVVYVFAIAVVLSNGQRVFEDDFAGLFIAFLVVNYMNSGPMETSQRLESGATRRPTIGYGAGMAYSYYEGYLMHIMTSDGYKYDGLVENLRKFEAQQGQVFPVKKMFLVVPRSLRCPTDLKEYNKQDRAYLEPLQSLEDVTKDVAAVKNRVFRNSVYKLYRSGARALCLAIECPTLLHTLYKVQTNRLLYGELADMDLEEIVQDFESTFMKIMEASPECRGKIVIVHFDDTDEKQNLADVLLDKIRELQPDFEDILERNAS